MTLAQPRIPGTTYFITTRCERRELRLPPTPETSAGIAVALAEAAERRRVRIVAASAPGNHIHLVVHDETGRVSAFMQDVFSLIGRFCNVRDGVKGIGFWNRQPAVAVALGDPQTVVEKVAYVIANPVTSFLVPKLSEWPGLKFEISDLGRWWGPIYKRPDIFFRKNGWVSDEVQVSSELPPMVEGAYGVEGFQKRVKVVVERLIAEAHAEAKAKGHGFVGIDKILRQSVWKKPSSPDDRKAGFAAEAIHRVAASTKARVRQMVKALLEFRIAHALAWEEFRRGLRPLFPPGTYKAWRFYGAARDDTSPPWAIRSAPSG